MNILRKKKEITSPFGCDFPGIVRRVLVACNGQLPKKINNKFVYSGVSPDIAGTIISKLGNAHENTY